MTRIVFMDLSIILLNYKQKGLLKQCIKGIVLAQPALSYEIIVVDNNSGDGSLEMVAAMFEPTIDDGYSTVPIYQNLKVPPIKTIQAGSNGGFAVGNNLGIKQASGKYIMILNSDIAVVPGALEKMYSFMEENLEVGIIGPKLINPDGSVQYSCRRFPSFLTPFYRRTFFGKLSFAKRPTDHYLMKDFDHKKNISVDWLFGACLLARKSALDKVGVFDENFFMYFEDLDLCRRFWQENFKVMYFTGVEMVHYHQRLSAQGGGVRGILTRGGRLHFTSGIRYFAKYLGKALPVQN